MKKTDRQKWIDSLDKVFSVIVRKKFADHRGLVQCCTCGVWKHWKQLQCGHFMTRNHLATRWEIKNAGPSCGACNGPKGGMQYEMSVWLDRTYGEGTAEAMRIKKNNFWKATIPDLKLLAFELRKQEKELKIM